MLPRLFDNLRYLNDTRYIDVLGVLNCCTKCEVTEVRNGSYTLLLETSVNDDCAEQLISQKILYVKPNPFDNPQYFEIQKTSRKIDGTIVVEAKHIKNMCYQICTEGDISSVDNPVHITGTPYSLWNNLVTNYLPAGVTMRFNFLSTISSTADLYLGVNAAENFGNILGGKEGSFLDLFGGEYGYDNFTIHYYSSRGSEKPYLIHYGENISDAIQSEDCESTYTHVLPYGKVSCLGELGSSRDINFFADKVSITNSESKYDKIYMLDCTDFLDSYQVGPQGANYTAVQNAMKAYAREYAKINNLGKLNINIQVTLRATLDEMSQIGLCDTVKVVLDNFGTQYSAKITEVTYDALMERWTKIVLGQPTITVADYILKKR